MLEKAEEVMLPMMKGEVLEIARSLGEKMCKQRSHCHEGRREGEIHFPPFRFTFKFESKALLVY